MKQRKRKIKIGGKAIAIETIVYVVIAIAALVILWLFLMKTSPAITETVESIVKGLGCQICGVLGAVGWIASGFCRGC